MNCRECNKCIKFDEKTIKQIQKHKIKQITVQKSLTVDQAKEYIEKYYIDYHDLMDEFFQELR